MMGYRYISAVLEPFWSADLSYGKIGGLKIKEMKTQVV
jgi:hypothetical protein